MPNKPEKKDLKKYEDATQGELSVMSYHQDRSFNSAYDQIFTWLPDEEEIKKILSDRIGVEEETDLIRYKIWREGIEDMVKAIAKRIGKED